MKWVLLAVVLLGSRPAMAADVNESYWHVDTFNAANLNAHGAGNLAMWCGVTEENPRSAGYLHTPGYGNDWHEILLYEATSLDPSMPDTVDLEFLFNYDYESGYGDKFTVEYDSAGTRMVCGRRTRGRCRSTTLRSRTRAGAGWKTLRARGPGW